MPTCVWQVRYLKQYRTKILVLADDFLLRIKFSTADTLYTQYQIQVSPFALFEFLKVQVSESLIKLSKLWIIVCSCCKRILFFIYVIFNSEQAALIDAVDQAFSTLTFLDYQISLMRYLKMIKRIPLPLNWPYKYLNRF